MSVTAINMKTLPFIHKNILQKEMFIFYCLLYFFPLIHFISLNVTKERKKWKDVMKMMGLQDSAFWWVTDSSSATNNQKLGSGKNVSLFPKLCATAETPVQWPRLHPSCLVCPWLSFDFSILAHTWRKYDPIMASLCSEVWSAGIYFFAALKYHVLDLRCPIKYAQCV